MAYPVSLTTILPGNQSFLVVAAPGATTGAFRLDHQGGTITVATRRSDYGNSASSWVSKIANKYEAAVQVTVAEDATTLESIYTLGSVFDVYVKRSSGATTYDKLASCLFAEQPKEIPEDGQSHRTIQVMFEGGTYTAGIAAGSVPTLAP